MIRETVFPMLALATLLLAACGGGDATNARQGSETATHEVPAAALTPDEKYNVTAKPSGPVKIDYRIIGTPVVGQPVTVDLEVRSNVGDRPVTLSYRSDDSTAMSFPETQLKSVALAFPGEDLKSGQQVTVTPLREGRLYLNVVAAMETDTGTLQTVTAIPIQVGSAPRQLEQNGVVTTDENGELVREMPASD